MSAAHRSTAWRVGESLRAGFSGSVRFVQIWTSWNARIVTLSEELELRSTKIVATIGPASRSLDVLERMIRAGMDVARLNFAHETPEEHADTVTLIRQASERAGREVAILQDVPGPKLRIGPVVGGVTELGTGTRVVLTPAQVEGTSERLPVAWP